MDIITIDEASSSSSSPSSSFPSSSSAAIQLGGRTLDRHNPIICDGRRNTFSSSNSSKSLLSPLCDFSHPPNSPQIVKIKKISSKVNKKTKTKNPSVKQQHNEEEKENGSAQNVHFQPSDDLKKSPFVPTDFVTKSFAKLSDLVTPSPAPAPAPAGSTRYLLESVSSQSEFFDGLSGFDPVFDLVPADYHKDLESGENNRDDCSSSSTIQASRSQPPEPEPESEPTPTVKQVVVLKVSLHCKGCEGKVRKHLSRMKGVTSFNIDNAAKNVTIEGDITPVGVLASLSKLKHVKFWTSQPPSTTPPLPLPLPQSPPSIISTLPSTSP